MPRLIRQPDSGCESGCEIPVCTPNIYRQPDATPRAGLGDLEITVGQSKGQTQNNQGDLRIDYTIGPRD